MPTLEAMRVVRYARKDQQPGDRFEASDKDAKILVAIGKAKLSAGPVKTPSDLPADVLSRAPQPELVKEVVQDESPKSQLYQRRDMVADAPKAESTAVEPMRFQPTPTRSPGKPKGRGPGRSGRGKM